MARVIALAFVALGYLAGDAASAQDVGTSDVYEYVQSRYKEIYEDAIAQYEKAAVENPGDVVLALRRCEAIEFFVYSEDYYNEDALDDAEACKQGVREQFGGHVEVLIKELQLRYDDRVAQDIEILTENHRGSYNRSQAARLYIELHNDYGYLETTESNEVACLRALQLDVATNCRIMAANHLIGHGQRDAAIAILTSPLDPHTEPFYLIQKIEKLADLEAFDAVASQFEQIGANELNDYVRVQLAAPLAKAGLRDEALAMLDDVSDEFWDQGQVLNAQFDVAMLLGDFEAAHSFYYERRALALSNDPLLRQRFELAGSDFSLGWRWVDLVGLGALLLLFTVVALIALVIPAGVHYRGLVRRSKSLMPGLVDSTWGLRHAAYVLAIILSISVLGLYVFEYDLFFATYFGEYWEEANWLDADLGRILLYNTIALTACLTPLLFLKNGWRQLGPGQWSIGKCIGVGIGLAIGMRLFFAIPIAMDPEQFGFGEMLLTPQAIREIFIAYGFLPVLFVTAVLVPIVEELAFRGVVFQGFSRHVTTTAANLLQGAIFAGLHESWLLFPFFLTFAFVAGVLVRKAGGLLPAIIMHAVFNGAAVSALAFGTTGT